MMNPEYILCNRKSIYKHSYNFNFTGIKYLFILEFATITGDCNIYIFKLDGSEFILNNKLEMVIYIYYYSTQM